MPWVNLRLFAFKTAKKVVIFTQNQKARQNQRKKGFAQNYRKFFQKSELMF
jgi:hypothetical protein